MYIVYMWLHKKTEDAASDFGFNHYSGVELSAFVGWSKEIKKEKKGRDRSKMYITKRDDVKARTHRKNIRKGEMERANPNECVYICSDRK